MPVTKKTATLWVVEQESIGKWWPLFGDEGCVAHTKGKAMEKMKLFREKSIYPECFRVAKYERREP